METNNDSKVMSPSDWLFNKHLPVFKEIVNKENYTKISFPQDLVVEYAAYVSQRSSSGSVWRKASEGFPVEGEPESLIGRHLRWAAIKEPFMISHFNSFGEFRYYTNGEGKSRHMNDCIDNIEYLDESASRPEIKLPEKISGKQLNYGYPEDEVWNNCIEETKRLNGIK